MVVKKQKNIPIKQQQKWCEKLQISSDFLNWQNNYENDYLASNETKLRSFKTHLNLRSIVIRVQVLGFEIVKDNLRTFCKKESTCSCFVSVK